MKSKIENLTIEEAMTVEVVRYSLKLGIETPTQPFNSRDPKLPEEIVVCTPVLR